VTLAREEAFLRVKRQTIALLVKSGEGGVPLEAPGSSPRLE